MFSQWLRENRRGLGLTQREMAPLVGLSPSALGMYEQGRRVPGRKAAKRLQEFFAAQGREMPAPPSVPVPSEQALLEKELRRLLKEDSGPGR